MLSFIRRIFVVLLAVSVTAAMGLSAVHATTMKVNMMQISSPMKTSSEIVKPCSSHCPAVPKMAGKNNMRGCVGSVYGALVVLLNLRFEPLKLMFTTISRFDQTFAPDSAKSEPARHPPRSFTV